MARKTIEKLGLYNNQSVLKNTGRDWSQWISILKKEGAANLPHKDIVAILKKKYRLTPWWQQSVALGYEIYIGKRVEGRNEKGEYSMTSTKTIPLSQKELWNKLTSLEGQKVWLNPMSPLEFKPKNTFEIRGGIFGAIRTMKAPERIRMSWQDTDWPKPSIINIQVVPPTIGKSRKKATDKAILVVSHGVLKDARLKEQMREHWKTALHSFLAYVLKDKQ